MQLKKLLLFILQYTAFGLAAAFLFLFIIADQPLLNLSFSSPFKPGHHSFKQAVTNTAPAVVNVYASEVYQPKPHPLFDDPLFRRFFDNAPTTSKKRIGSSIGSGVIMNTQGYILTNAHVIQTANDIRITLDDGRQAQAQVIGIDTDTDLAVLNINLPNLPTISVGDSSKLAVGDVVLAIGNPYNFGQTVTQGIISALNRKRRGISSLGNFIQTDADINLGNSGGALVNTAGELIGINTAIISKSGGSEGIGLATPINQALHVMRQIIKHGKVVRGWLGIEAQLLSKDVIETTNLTTGGVLVTAIMRDSPAENAGIVPGDIIIRIDGKNIITPDQAIETLSNLIPGSEVQIEILRGWEQQRLTARITQRPYANRTR